MTKQLIQNLEQLQESNLFSSQLTIEESMDLRSKHTLTNAREVDRKSQLALSIQSSNPLRKKDLSPQNGVMNRLAEPDEDIIILPTQVDPSSMMSSTSKSVCCADNKNHTCRRTWIANNIGKFIAYAVLTPEYAEEWMAETDYRRDAVVEKAGFKSKRVLCLFDTWWAIELLIGKLAHIWSWFRCSKER